ncbi:HNH endonuclease [Streptomyces sp. TRM 70361]|uniref:HNH endonuclease n=1 Tax=Streptomyces sp. TRM 70361 TaxID=3116553 RepID=UPI002E7C3A12|nr:HNH endonuclease [Streptomyces sp. TRM 70361]MEE1941645.1 HNH endonuclease [Streptomyces sp. TRM 70361]
MLPVFDEPADESLAPDGTPWWMLKTWPGSKVTFGGEPRIAAWLWFNKEIGETFTMREIREKLGKEVAEDAEHLNRRLRELRKFGWKIPSHKEDRTLPVNTYRLEGRGKKIWIKAERTKRNAVSGRIRRQVFERDGYRCKLCGVGSGEEYPRDPGSKARMTVGHRIPQERGGSSEPDNLRTECSKCNEELRDDMRNPETYAEVLTEVKNLRTADLRSLLTWLQAGERTRSRLDEAFDRARMLSHDDYSQLIKHLKSRLG